MEGDAGIEIHRVATIESAGPGDVTFLANPKYAGALASTRASAVIAAPGVDAPCAVIRSTNPYLMLARAVQALSPGAAPEPGVHALAVVSPGAQVDPTAAVGAFAVIGFGAVVGARTVVHAHVVVGARAVIGPDCLLHAHVSIREGCTLGARVVVQDGAVIGSDGFGFAHRSDGTHEKIPQVGPVVIEDDVEIGANTTIDRPALGETRIKSGTKIDNLVQIAHGVVVGHNALLAAQVGIAGSSVVGDRVMLGGQVGVTGHVTLGDGSSCSAKTGITNSVEPGVLMSGYPAQENGEWRRSYAALRRLPDLRRQVMDLQRRLEELERAGAGSREPGAESPETRAQGPEPKRSL